MQTQRLTTVTTAATNFKLCARAAIKAELSITDGASDALIDQKIGEASELIARHCNRVFARETVQDQIRRVPAAHRATLRDRGWPLQLSRWPLASVTSVTEDGTALTGGTDYEINADVGQLVRLDGSDGLSRWGGLKTVAVFVAGFYLPDDSGYVAGAAASLPGSVELAARKVSKLLWFDKARDPRLRSEQVEGVGRDEYWVGSLGEDGALPPEILGLLSPFRQVPV